MLDTKDMVQKTRKWLTTNTVCSIINSIVTVILLPIKISNSLFDIDDNSVYDDRRNTHVPTPFKKTDHIDPIGSYTTLGHNSVY